MNFNRRRFIQAAGAGMAALAVPPLFPRSARAMPSGDPVIVMLFLRGGADALTHVVPDPTRPIQDGGPADLDYTTLRGAIQLPYDNPSDQVHQQLLTALPQNFQNAQSHSEKFFAMNSTLDEMLHLYTEVEPSKPKLAVIHGAGNTELTNRSHFAAEDAMERGVRLPIDASDGWLSRAVERLAENSNPVLDSPLTGVSLAANPIGSLAGGTQNLTLALRNLNNFGLTEPNASERRTTLTSVFEKFPPGPPKAASSIAGRAGNGLYTALDQLRDENLPTAATAGDYQRDDYNDLPQTMFERLRDAARMIKADFGVRAVAIDFQGGWDYHTNILQQTPMYTARLAATLSRFYDDLANDALAGPGSPSAADRTVTIVTSEFGRNVRPNGGDTTQSGTDHGHGGIMYVVGKDVVGGRVLCRALDTSPDNEIGWPALNDLQDGQDLRATIDFRDVLAQVVEHQYGFTPSEVQGLFSPSDTGTGYLPRALPDGGLF